MTTLVRLFARPALAALFVTSGFRAVRKPQNMAPAAEPVVSKVSPLLQRVLPAQVASKLPTDTVGLVRLNGGVHLVAGSMFALGRWPRLAATALAVSVVPTTVAGHPFWSEHDPEHRAAMRIHFFKNLGLLGGLLLGAVDTAGQPGLVWRARRGGRDIARTTRTAKREAKLSTRAAKAQAKRVSSEGRRRLESAGHTVSDTARDVTDALPG